MSVVQGQRGASTPASDLNALDFLIQRALQGINTAEPVRVMGVSAEGVQPVGFVSVQPLVNLVAGDGKGHQQGTLFRLPYFRAQGGENAVIVDPKPGDIGLAVYAMRDTESVKEKRDGASTNPGSARMCNKGDGFFIGGFLNKAPKRYVMVNDDGITLDDGAGGKMELKGGQLVITAPGGIIRNAPTDVQNGEGATSTLNGNLQVNGKISSSGDQTAGGISQMHHTHTGVLPGGGSTGEPQ